MEGVSERFRPRSRGTKASPKPSMAETGEVTRWKGVGKRKDRLLGEGKRSGSWVGERIPSMRSSDSAEGKFLRVGGGLRVRRESPRHGVVGSSSLQVPGLRGC